MPTASTKAKTTRAPKGDYACLGRIVSLGPKSLPELPFLLPNSYQDLRHPYRRLADAPIGEATCFELVLRRKESQFDPPRAKLRLEDASGRTFNGWLHGDTRAITFILDEPILIAGIRIGEQGDRLRVTEIIPTTWRGRVRPVYPGRKHISAKTVGDRMLELISTAITHAASDLDRSMVDLAPPDAIKRALGCPDWPTRDLLMAAHLPQFPEQGEHAQTALERLAALLALHRARENLPTKPRRTRLALRTWRQRLAQYEAAQASAPSFCATHEQRDIIAGLVEDVQAAMPARALVNGDVGCGKSITYQVLSAAVYDAGGRVLILLPNLPMAQQSHRELQQAFPDIPVHLVSGKTRDADIAAAPVVVGTTALLFRDASARDLVVVDEQQKFSAAQRGAYVTDDTHLVELSATCLPRTLALARYGAVKVYELKQAHTPKILHTRVWAHEERRELFRSVKQTLAAGDRVFVLCPLKESDEDTDRQNVAKAHQLWCKHFPDRVASLTGSDEPERKDEVLQALRDNKIDILVTTSLVEVGINTMRLRRVIVLGAECFGLTQLHQLRGRLAREGGEGWFDLCPTGPLTEKAQTRLEVLCRSTNGFEIAEADMRLRGVGDLSSEAAAQSGADETFLFGRPLRFDRLEEVAELHLALSRRSRRSAESATPSRPSAP